MKQKYYSVNNILKHKPQYAFILGERSNGKSYDVKRYNLTKAYEQRKATFVYLRRFDLDIKTDSVESYFADSPVKEITHGEYNCITVYRSGIFFSNIDVDTGKVTRGLQCGRALCLSGSEHYKSQAFPDCTDIIFEEVCTKSRYLEDEPNKLMDLVSTIFRRRLGIVWCIGNTISRISPYYGNFGLKNVPFMKQGSIEDYDFTTSEYDEDGKPIIVRVSVEYADNSGRNSKMFFGEHAKSITSGAYETHEHPHLPKCEWEMCYQLLLEYNDFVYCGRLLINEDGEMLFYIFPYKGGQQIDRVITNKFTTDIFKSQRFRRDIKPELIILDLVSNGKVAFKDNLTGDEFYQLLPNWK